MKRMVDNKELNNLESSVNSLYNGYTSPSASTKKIYCHNIIVDYEGDNAKIHCALLILNNTSSQINTYTLFNTILLNILNSNEKSIPLTGGLYYMPGSSLHIAQYIGNDSGKLNLYTTRPDGTKGNFLVENYLETATFNDTVISIN